MNKKSKAVMIETDFTEDQIVKSFQGHFPADTAIARSFAKACVIQKFGKGEIIKKSGHPEKWISLILSGCAAVFVSREKRTVCLDICLENDFLVEYESLVTAKESEACTQALEPLIIAKIPIPEKGCSGPDGLDAILRMASAAMFIDRQDRLIGLLTETPKERFQKIRKQYPEIAQRVSVTVLASWLGITREHLSRLRGKK